MFHIVLFQPRIPPNTGNVIRLCANTGASLHLIHPLGFDLDERRLKRAGLDYHEFAAVREHPTLESFLDTVRPVDLMAFSTRGGRRYDQARFRPGQALLFGSETAGLPTDVLTSLPSDRVMRIPMRPDSRSLNLSNAVAIVVYEAWRQQGFTHGA
ncbi:MAG: tRNA (cytidine(34)-2'-O)-methyltransferase [Pseudomonadota bacterium]|nr:tRNA (cytidine(34)-2'-O)-methyltransferase [Pseudomonadota bacterium]